MRSICPATQTFHDKPKECPSLDETIAASLRGPPSHITMANSKSFNVALRLILQGFSKPHDRRIIAFQGPKVATDTITKELLSSIALSASIDSNRVYCIETAVLHTETCAFQRCQELASKNGNLVMVVLANTNQDELQTDCDLRTAFLRLGKVKNVAVVMTRHRPKEWAVSLEDLTVVLSVVEG